jgi:hypothetical protein
VIARGTQAYLPEAEFERMALELFSYQFAANPLYRGFCEARAATPYSVRSLDEIPAVPTDAFKAAPIVSGDAGRAEVVFRTSGTTLGSERRGTHYMLDTRLYRAVLRAGFQTHLLPDLPRIRIAALVPTPIELSDSSLSFMIGEVVEAFGAAGSDFYVRDGDLEVERFLTDARAAKEAGELLLIVGTSFAFVHLLDALVEARRMLRLPEGSRAMDTGGFKGRSRAVERAELYRAMEERFAIPEPFIVNEYGMTEMTSQFYDAAAGTGEPVGAGRRHRGPPWVRTTAADPETLESLPAGSVGILRHVDLANLDSVIAIQTADLGVVRKDGFELLGRAEGAEPRGCSIAMDELLDVLRNG